jgi:hypothetical protein
MVSPPWCKIKYKNHKCRRYTNIKIVNRIHSRLQLSRGGTYDKQAISNARRDTWGRYKCARCGSINRLYKHI